MSSFVLGFIAFRITIEEKPSGALLCKRSFSSVLDNHIHILVTIVYSGFSHLCF